MKKRLSLLSLWFLTHAFILILHSLILIPPMFIISVIAHYYIADYFSSILVYTEKSSG